MSSAIAEQTIKEHAKLLNLINGLEAALTRFPRDIEWGDSVWAQDQEFLDFVKVQGISLVSAQESALNGFYRETYNTIRMVFESYLLLRLISTCDKFPTWYKVRRSDGESLDEAKTKAKQKLARENIPNLIKTEDEGKDSPEIVIMRRGMRIIDDNGNDTGVIVPYYYGAWNQFLSKEHHLRKPEVKKELLQEWATLKSRRAEKSDKRHSLLYLRLFTFNSMVKNLRWNGVLSFKTAARVIVHYNFLSGFTHSTKDAIKLSRPWKSFATANADTAYNHYKSELALLYVCHLLAMHLELVLFYFKRWRPLQVKNIRKLYRPLCTKVNQDFGYFWFIFNGPHEFDKYEHANRKCNYKKRIFYRPDQIRAGDVHYYDDPLDRLRKMHQSVNEGTTGNVFISPFPREDAQYYL